MRDPRAMDDLFNINSFLRALRSYSPWQVALEMLLIGAVVYWVVRFLQGTRGARLLKGIVLVLITLYLVVRLLKGVAGLQIVDFLYGRFLLFAGLAIVVVFQPELRRALMRLGETRLFRGLASQVDREVDELMACAAWCSRNKIGALVALEREVGLGGVTDEATRVNADLTADLLNTIFYPNSPLHDLGVVVANGRIMYAGVQFPLAEAGELEADLGSRHRAAVGLSQESDAVVLVVSEETGDVSLAERGALFRKLQPDALREMLVVLLRGERQAAPPVGTGSTLAMSK